MKDHKPSIVKMLAAAVLVLALSYWGSQILVRLLTDLLWDRA
jgi:hypothetical protein